MNLVDKSSSTWSSEPPLLFCLYFLTNQTTIKTPLSLSLCEILVVVVIPTLQTSSTKKSKLDNGGSLGNVQNKGFDSSVFFY